MAGEREVESVNGEWSMVKSEMGSNRLLVDGGNACFFEVVVQGFVLSLFVLTQKKSNPKSQAKTRSLRAFSLASATHCGR